MRTLLPVEHFVHDLRFGARLLARGRGFTTVALISLALGIGASSSIFSVINGLVLRPLPVTDPYELHIAQRIEPHEVDQLFSSADVERTSALLAGRAEIAALSSTDSALVQTRGDTTPPETARLQLVAGNFFGTLRQRAQIGRLLDPNDNRTVGQHPVAVISDRFWTRRFGRAGHALGSELIVNGTPLAIVGVAAPRFSGASVDSLTPDIWAPAAMQAELRFAGSYERSGGDPKRPWPSQPEIAWLRVMLRVPEGGARMAADGMTRAVYAGSGDPSMNRDARDARHEGNQPGQPRQPGQTGQPGQPGQRDQRNARESSHASPIPVTLIAGSGGFSSVRSELTTPLMVLLVMVGLLLALACVNIASLLLARAMSRSREIAIRLSMGAGRGRLIRQLLTESVLLAFVGGALGLVLTHWGSATLLSMLTYGAPADGIDVSPDWRVVSVTLATSIAAALAFGLLPALRGTRLPLADSLKAQTRSVIGMDRQSGRLPVGKLLIAGQMAFAILLLLVAALFSRSLQALTQVDVGYDRDALLVARIDPRSAGYALSELPALHARVIERLDRLPGVTAVSMSANGPFSGLRSRGDFQVEGYTPGPNEPMIKHSEWVTSDYFRSVGLTIKQGRGFGPEDIATSRRVSVINETMARRYFGNRSPIGKRWGDGTSDFDRHGLEVIGVVEDARYNDVKAESLSIVYMPLAQSERYARSLEVRASSGNPAALASAVRSALREVEPRLPLGSLETLDERVVRSIRVERLLGWLTLAFGAAALALACLGLYGTISYAVRRRTAELGLRMALGADRTAVQWLIVREALLLVLVGGALGLPAAFLAARAIRGLLYATAPFDPIAYATAAGVLVIVSTLAAYIPARRASRLDPMIALRTD